MSPREKDEREPWESLQVAVEISSTPARAWEPNDAIRHGRARLFRYEDEEIEGPALATLEWTHIEYGFGMEDGIELFDIADAESQDLCTLHETLFDGAGDLLPPFDKLAGITHGNDLYVIDRVQVTSTELYNTYASELIEHVLRRWAQGCFAAAYIQDRPMDARLVEVLLARGFEWHQQEGFGLYLADLGTPRPTLAGEEDEQEVPRPKPGTN